MDISGAELKIRRNRELTICLQVDGLATLKNTRMRILSTGKPSKCSTLKHTLAILNSMIIVQNCWRVNSVLVVIRQGSSQ